MERDKDWLVLRIERLNRIIPYLRGEKRVVRIKEFIDTQVEYFKIIGDFYGKQSLGITTDYREDRRNHRKKSKGKPRR